MPSLDLALDISAVRMPGVSVPQGYDPAAEDFLQRAGIWHPTQQEAVNQLVLDLKAANLWTKVTAFYPFVGGNAESHRHNLKSASYTVTWTAGVTHSASGVTGNGTSGYGDTGFNPTTAGLAWNDTTLGAYVNAAGTSANKPLIVAQNDGTSSECLLLLNTTPLATFDSGNYSGRAGSVSIAGLTGFFSGSRGGATDERMYRNGVLIDSTTGTGAAPTVNLNLFMFAFNYGGGPALYSDHKMAFACIGNNLTGTEHLALYNAIQKFQTALGRQV